MTDAVTDEAVAQGIAATDDLDWKSALPPTNRLNETDLSKDIAAMAHNGGGTIVYGVEVGQSSAVFGPLADSGHGGVSKLALGDQGLAASIMLRCAATPRPCCAAARETIAPTRSPFSDR